MPITYTPLRFPGGKSKLYPFMVELIRTNNLQGCTYGEVFCGGAGLAMKLLLRNDVANVILNDYDPAIYSIWNVILNHSDELCEFIETVPLTIDEWYRCRDVYRKASCPSVELGKAAFYLNRTNRSGILAGGVIGGKEQRGKYKIGARFTRQTLCEKVQAISNRSDAIQIHNLDALDFMHDIAPTIGNHSLLYLDPPYVKKGPELYQNSFSDYDHRELAKCIKTYNNKWVVTYDIDDLINQLYKPSDDWQIITNEIRVGYSAARSRNIATERLVLSPGLTMPADT